MTIRAKIGLALGISIGAMVLGVSASWFLFERRQLDAAIEESQNSQLNMWAAVCREAQLSQSDLALLSYLQVLKKTEGLAFAYLVNSEEEIVAHTDPRFILRPLKDWLKENSSADSLLRERNLNPEARSARAVLGFSKAHLERTRMQATRKILRTVLQVGTLALLLGLGVAWKVSSYLSSQILVLYQGAEQIGTGNFSARVPVLSADELGGLAQRFNHMAQKLSDLNELKDSLITNVSHDLRSPMSSIMMYAEYLLSQEKGGLNDRQKRMLDIIKSNASRLGVFVNNILDMAKIKDGKMQYRFQPCQLKSIVEPICQLFQASAELRSIALVASLPESLSPVLADEERLEQVFSNLISNALKFTPDRGNITISAKNTGAGMQVSVADTGKGIPAKDLGKIFEKFEQADVESQKSLKIRGTGLGLSIVRETIEKHGGRIWFESELGRGTTFHFTLPLAPTSSCTQRNIKAEKTHG